MCVSLFPYVHVLVVSARSLQRALDAAFVFNENLKRAYPRGCSKDRFIREQFQSNWHLLLPEWIHKILTQTCTGCAVQTKDEDKSLVRFVWLSNDLATIHWCAGTTKQVRHSHTRRFAV